MRKMLMSIAAVWIFAAAVTAVEKTNSLAGTWVLDPDRSDSGAQMRRNSPIWGTPGSGGAIGGIGIPGIGYPGAGYPRGQTAGQYPNGRDGDDGEWPGDGIPRKQMQNLTLQIVQTENEVQTTRQFALDGEKKTIAQKFLLDGSENSNPASDGRGGFTCRSVWKKDKLVNSGTESTSIRGRGVDMPLVEEYSLSKGGRVLTIKTTRTTPRGESSFKLVFDRLEGASESTTSLK